MAMSIRSNPARLRRPNVVAEHASKRLASLREKRVVSQPLRRVWESYDGESTSELAVKLLFSTRLFLSGSDTELDSRSSRLNRTPIACCPRDTYN